MKLDALTNDRQRLNPRCKSALATRTEDSIVIILGPSQRPNVPLVQHEYLHEVVGPMIDRQADALSQSEQLFELVASESSFFSEYASWPLVVEESLLRAMPPSS